MLFWLLPTLLPAWIQDHAVWQLSRIAGCEPLLFLFNSFFNLLFQFFDFFGYVDVPEVSTGPCFVHHIDSLVWQEVDH
jgi:hypothetical protein